MEVALQLSAVRSGSAIAISGSKSETNRLLLLQALYPNIQLQNTSNSDDSLVMEKALSSSEETINIHHSGTAMRFLNAYFAAQEGRTVVLTGSSRMKERPISILVEALRQLGAKIEYLENEGFPPLKITGQKITASKVALQANVSSQYISALLLIASKLENGIEITLEGPLTSIPYINMTLALLQEIGIETAFEGNTIRVKPSTNHQPITLTVESDWSSASYFYSIVALSEVGTTIRLSSYKKNSLQGDSALVTLYENFGVTTTFDGNTICLTKTYNVQPTPYTLQLNNTPDIAQTIAVTCLGLGLGCHLSGLHTLKIKETDRLEALQMELTKLGAEVTVTEDTLTLKATTSIPSNVKIGTYTDHRMAMAFAPLALKVPIVIKDAEVVSKSYPNFWSDLKAVGFQIS